MSRISRYVFREILGPTLLGLLVFGVVLVMPLLLEAAELYIRRDLSVSLVGLYLALALPHILVLVIPMAVLLGVLVGIGRLAADSEITALRACGYSDRRLLVPVLTLGVVAAIGSGALFNFAVPAANYAQHQLNARIFLAADINREIQPRVFYERIPDMLIYADAASPADGTLERVLIYQKVPGGSEEISSAATATVRQQPEQGSIEFHLNHVVSHSWQSAVPGTYEIKRSDTAIFDRPPDLFMVELIRSLASPPPRNLREQTVPELAGTLEQLRGRPATQGRDRQISETLVEMNKKFSLPTTCFVFALLALPLALGRGRSSSRTWGFVMSILVIIISYVFITAGEQLADRGRIPPAVGMWAGNAVFFAVGILMLASHGRVDRGRRQRRTPARAPEPPLDPEDASPGPASGDGSQDQASGTTPQRRFPSTIDRYLLKHLLSLSATIALSLVVLFTLFYAIDLVDDLSHGHRQYSLLFPYLLYLQPQVIFAYVAPISICMGTLVTFALLARTHELTAIRAGGISLFRVAAPFIAASVVVAALSFAAHDAVLPYSNQKANQLRDQMRNRSPRSYRQPERRWVFGSQGLLFNFSDFNPTRNEFQDLSVIRFRPGTLDIAERIFSPHAIWETGSWVLLDGWVRTFDDDKVAYAAFDRRSFADFDPPDYFVQEWKAPDQMNYRELSTYVKDLERRGYNTRELRVGLYRKIAIPAVCIVMVIVGLPFALRIERRGPVFAIAVSIMLVFVYFGVLQAFGKLGEVAVLPPLMAAWAPNLLFAGFGLYLSATARW